METIIRFAAAETALRLDRETLLMLLDIFFSTREEYIRPLREAIESRNVGDLRSEAHRLKGAANNLRVDGIGTLALDIETASAQPDWELLERKLGEIETAFGTGQEELAVLKSGA